MSFFSPVFEKSKKKAEPTLTGSLDKMFPHRQMIRNVPLTPKKPTIGQTVKHVGREILAPKRGFEDEETWKGFAEATAKDKAIGTAKAFGEFGVGISQLSRMGLEKIPGFNKLFPSDPTFVEKVEKKILPKTSGEAGTMRALDIAAWLPATAGRISKLSKVDEIIKASTAAKNPEAARLVLKASGATDEFIDSLKLDRQIANAKTPEAVRDIFQKAVGETVPTKGRFSFTKASQGVPPATTGPMPPKKVAKIASNMSAEDASILRRYREAPTNNAQSTSILRESQLIDTLKLNKIPFNERNMVIDDLLKQYDYRWGDVDTMLSPRQAPNVAGAMDIKPVASTKGGPLADDLSVTLNKSSQEELVKILTATAKDLDPASISALSREQLINQILQRIPTPATAGQAPAKPGMFRSAVNNLRNPAMRQGGYVGKEAPEGMRRTPTPDNQRVSSTNDSTPKVAEKETTVSKTAQDAKTKPLSQAEIDKLPLTEQRVIRDFPEIGSAEGLRALRSNTRGTISKAEAEAAARKLNFTERKILDMEPGTILNKEEVLALRGVIENSINVLERMEARLLKLTPGSAEANALRVDISSQKMHVYKMKAVERGVAAESGRLLESFKHNANAIAESEKRIVKMLSDKKTPQDVKDYILRRIGAFNGTTADFNKLLREVSQATVMDMIVEFATAMKLYAIPTHIVNTVTSLASMKLNILNRAVAATLEVPIAALKGRQREAFFSDVRNEWIGQTVGWRDAGRQAVRAFADENYAWEARKLQDFQPRGPAIKGRPGKDTIFDKSMDVGGKAIRASFRLLGVEDVLIRTPSQMGAMYVELGRQAIKAGHKPGSKSYSEFIANGVHNPSQELLEMASKRADRDLFQETLHPFFADIQNFRNAWPGTKLIIPFFRTIVNLQKRAIEMSPAAPILPSVRKQLATPGESSEAIARMTIGSAAMIPLYFYAQEGGITLASPKNPAERDAFFAEGKQPYSVKVGDKWYPYHRMSPFSEWFVTAAYMKEAVDNDDEKTLTELTTNTFFSLGANMLDKSFATGLAEFLDAWAGSEYEREQWMRNFITGSTMPTLLGNITRSQDPVVREVNSIKEAYMSRTPGLSTKLPPRRDVFGEEITRPGSAAARLISPIVPSPIQTNIVREELDSLGMQLGFPERSVGSFKMEDHQYRLFKEITGKTTYNVLSEMIMTPEYQRLNARQKEQAINKIITGVRSAVRIQVATDKAIAQELRKRLQDQGMTSSEATAKAEEIMKQLKEANNETKK
jgi:hypothetical protein